MNRQSTENVRAVQTLYGIVMMNTCGYTFVQSHRMNTLIVNPKVNYRRSVILMGQCRFILTIKKVYHPGE